MHKSQIIFHLYKLPESKSLQCWCWFLHYKHWREEPSLQWRRRQFFSQVERRDSYTEPHRRQCTRQHLLTTVHLSCCPLSPHITITTLYHCSPHTGNISHHPPQLPSQPRVLLENSAVR